jgi:hypothetical protein
VWVLHLGDAAGSSPAAFRWEEVKMGLPAPAPRFDHTCCAIPTLANSQHPDKLVLLGGRDSSQHFTDGWWLDLSTWTWQTGAGVPALGSQVRTGVRVSVEAALMCGAACIGIGKLLACVHTPMPQPLTSAIPHRRPATTCARPWTACPLGRCLPALAAAPRSSTAAPSRWEEQLAGVVCN